MPEETRPVALDLLTIDTAWMLTEVARPAGGRAIDLCGAVRETLEPFVRGAAQARGEEQDAPRSAWTRSVPLSAPAAELLFKLTGVSQARTGPQTDGLYGLRKALRASGHAIAEGAELGQVRVGEGGIVVLEAPALEAPAEPQKE